MSESENENESGKIEVASVITVEDLAKRFDWAVPVAEKLMNVAEPYFEGGRTRVFDVALAHAMALVACCRCRGGGIEPKEVLEIVTLVSEGRLSDAVVEVESDGVKA